MGRRSTTWGISVSRVWRKANRNQSMTGLVVAIVGALIAYASFEYVGSIDGAMIGAMMAAFGLAIMYVNTESWYCQNCGQRLGKISKPRKCGRCDSNRIAQRDPGVGEAVRVKRQR